MPTNAKLATPTTKSKSMTNLAVDEDQLAQVTNSSSLSLSRKMALQWFLGTVRCEPSLRDRIFSLLWWGTIGAVKKRW